jgi:hypothetical protein
MDWKAYRPALMHRCRHAQASTFIPDRVNIKQPGTITLEQTEIANVPAETQGITNRPLVDGVINKVPIHRHQRH